MSFWNKIGIVSKKDYDDLYEKIAKLENLNEKLIIQQNEMNTCLENSIKKLAENVGEYKEFTNSRYGELSEKLGENYKDLKCENTTLKSIIERLNHSVMEKNDGVILKLDSIVQENEKIEGRNERVENQLDEVKERLILQQKELSLSLENEIEKILEKSREYENIMDDKYNKLKEEIEENHKDLKCENAEIIKNEVTLDKDFRVLSENISKSSNNIIKNVDNLYDNISSLNRDITYKLEEINNAEISISQNMDSISESIEKRDVSQISSFSEVIDSCSDIKEELSKIENELDSSERKTNILLSGQDSIIKYCSDNKEKVAKNFEDIITNISDCNSKIDKQNSELAEMIRKIVDDSKIYNEYFNDLKKYLFKLEQNYIGIEEIITKLEVGLGVSISNNKNEFSNLLENIRKNKINLESNMKDEYDETNKKFEKLISCSESINKSLSNIGEDLKIFGTTTKDTNKKLISNSKDVVSNKEDLSLVKKSVENISEDIENLESMIKILWINEELNNLDKSMKK